MYLSRVKLNTGKRKTQIALVSPNKIHGAVENAFAKKQQRNLWRIDQLSGESYLLILSSDEPDLSVIISQFGFDNESGEIRDYKVLLEKITQGSMWHFRLVANPTYSKKTDAGRGKICAHVSEKYQLEWLYQKAKNNGFRLVDGSVILVGTTWKAFKKNNVGKSVRIKEASFEGVLIVNDVELFKHTLTYGIGREKAYGMGLLTIIHYEGNNGQ